MLYCWIYPLANCFHNSQFELIHTYNFYIADTLHNILALWEGARASRRDLREQPPRSARNFNQTAPYFFLSNIKTTARFWFAWEIRYELLKRDERRESERERAMRYRVPQLKCHINKWDTRWFLNRVCMCACVCDDTCCSFIRKNCNDVVDV